MQVEFLSRIVATLPLVRVETYLDPGSGSFIIQLLIGGLVGAGFLIKAYWRKIKGLFNRNTPTEDTENTDDTNPE